MTLNEWRETPEQVKALFDFMHSAYGHTARLLLVEEASRATAPVNVADVTGTVHRENAEFILGFQFGKRYAVELLDAMQVIPEPLVDRDLAVDAALKQDGEQEGSFR